MFYVTRTEKGWVTGTTGKLRLYTFLGDLNLVNSTSRPRFSKRVIDARYSSLHFSGVLFFVLFLYEHLNSFSKKDFRSGLVTVVCEKSCVFEKSA